MKTIKDIFVITFVLIAAATLLVSAQDSQTSAETSTESAAPAKKTTAKKTVKSKLKKKVKKPAAKPVSEYIFNKMDSVPAYKFDKHANPIIKEAKPKKKTAKAAKGKSVASQAQQKLKAQPPIEGDGQKLSEGDRQTQGQEGE